MPKLKNSIATFCVIFKHCVPRVIFHTKHRRFVMERIEGENCSLSLQVGNFRFLFPWLLIAFGTFDFTRLTSQLVVSNGVGNNKVTQKYFLDGSNPYFLASLGSKEEVTLVLP